MKFSCEKTLLQAAVNTASRAVSSKSSIPALEGVLLHADTTLTISGYDMKTGIRTTVDADITETGTLVLSTRLFGDILRHLPDDVVVLQSDNNLNVKLTCGDAAYDILAISAEDYPDLPEVEDQHSVTITQTTLRAMISQTSFAVSTNEARPVHTGSLFEINESVPPSAGSFCGRSGLPYMDKPVMGAFSFVAPGAALNEVERICGDTDDEAVITLGNRHLLFQVGPTQLICRRLEGDFLDYKSAIPRSNPTVVTAETKTLTDSIERVSVVISEKQKSPVRCVFEDGQVRMSAKTAIGEAKDVCPVEGDGSSLEIGFNNRYLLDALKYAPADKVRLELNTGISPCILTPVEGEENFLYMVLPVRLKNS